LHWSGITDFFPGLFFSIVGGLAKLSERAVSRATNFERARAPAVEHCILLLCRETRKRSYVPVEKQTRQCILEEHKDCIDVVLCLFGNESNRAVDSMGNANVVGAFSRDNPTRNRDEHAKRARR